MATDVGTAEVKPGKTVSEEIADLGLRTGRAVTVDEAYDRFTTVTDHLDGKLLGPTEAARHLASLASLVLRATYANEAERERIATELVQLRLDLKAERTTLDQITVPVRRLYDQFKKL